MSSIQCVCLHPSLRCFRWSSYHCVSLRLRFTLPGFGLLSITFGFLSPPVTNLTLWSSLGDVILRSTALVRSKWSTYHVSRLAGWMTPQSTLILIRQQGPIKRVVAIQHRSIICQQRYVSRRLNDVRRRCYIVGFEVIYLEEHFWCQVYNVCDGWVSRVQIWYVSSYLASRNRLGLVQKIPENWLLTRNDSFDPWLTHQKYWIIICHFTKLSRN